MSEWESKELESLLGPMLSENKFYKEIPYPDIFDVYEGQDSPHKGSFSPETPPIPGHVVYLMPDGTQQTRFSYDIHDAAPLSCEDGWAIPVERIELCDEPLRKITYKESSPVIDIVPDGSPIPSNWVPGKSILDLDERQQPQLKPLDEPELQVWPTRRTVNFLPDGTFEIVPEDEGVKPDPVDNTLRKEY